MTPTNDKDQRAAVGRRVSEWLQNTKLLYYQVSILYYKHKKYMPTKYCNNATLTDRCPSVYCFFTSSLQKGYLKNQISRSYKCMAIGYLRSY